MASRTGASAPGGYRVVILTADRHDDAHQLADELRRQAGLVRGTRADFDVVHDSSALTDRPEPDEPTTALVILGGPATALDPDIAASAGRCQRFMRICAPVYDPAHSFWAQHPDVVHVLNGVPWSPGAEPYETASTVLRLLGMTESDRRVFISYRRTDGSPLAHQLRYALIDAGWDVFLDRYSVPPAVDFQAALDRDLADKCFVLLLETPEAKSSTWVQQEVSFAFSHRLGLLSVSAAGVTDEQSFAAVPDDMRLRLEGVDQITTPHGVTLTDVSLSNVMRTIDQRHAQAYQQRREILLQETTQELQRCGYQVRPLDHWVLLAHGRERDEVVVATGRAPEPADLLEADRIRLRMRSAGRSCRGWVVHPLEDIDPMRAKLIGWLSMHRLVGPSPLMLLSSRVSR